MGDINFMLDLREQTLLVEMVVETGNPRTVEMQAVYGRCEKTIVNITFKPHRGKGFLV